MPTSTTTCSASRSPTARRSGARWRKACSTASACRRSACARTGYAAEDFDWPRAQGFRVVQAEECWYKSLAPLMAEVREQLGAGPGLSQLRHRRARSLLGARHRHAGDRRPDHDPGHRDHPRLPRPRHRRLRPGRGRAALRPHRQHRAAGGEPAVRDALRPAGRAVPELTIARCVARGRPRLLRWTRVLCARLATARSGGGKLRSWRSAGTMFLPRSPWRDRHRP